MSIYTITISQNLACPASASQGPYVVGSGGAKAGAPWTLKRCAVWTQGDFAYLC